MEGQTEKILGILGFLKFDVIPYGELQQYTKTLSKCRCRIFYKYANRNGSYITDEFAEELLKTLPYTPIKGIYDQEDEDYTDHGRHNSEGKIYGVVPANNNFAWEKHLDVDGVERIYACVDVLVYTSLYKEAGKILEKGQSMELYADSVTGEWQDFDGVPYFVFKTGCFLGLQILGDDVEPCFEGASFYSLNELLEAIRKDLKEYSLNNHINNAQEGTKMKIKFAKKTDDFSTLWQLLNTKFTEADEWIVTHELISMSDNEIMVYNLENEAFEKFSITKEENQNESGEISYELKLGDSTPIQVISANCDELNDFMKKLEIEGENVTDFTQYAAAVDSLLEKFSEKEQNFVEKETLISTLQTEKEQLQNQLNTKEEELSNVKTELAELEQYKKNIEDSQKDEIISKYSLKLEPEVINSFIEKKDGYTIEDLEKELAYALVSTCSSVFTDDDSDGSGRIPKAKVKTGLEAILSKY